MVKKRLIIAMAISLMGFSGMVKAQDPFVTFNVRGGLNLSTYGGNLHDTKMVVREQVGIGIDLAVTNNVYLLTGVDYQTKGSKAKQLSGRHIKYNAEYIQLPLYVAYKERLSRRVKFVSQIGPYFAFGVGGKIKGETKVNTFGDGRLKKFDCGASVALGIDLRHNSFKVGYDYGFNNISDAKGVRIRNCNLFVTSGYVF